MRKTIVTLVVCAVLVGGLGWLAFGRGHLVARVSAAGEQQIKIDNYSFMPQDITIAAGTTVTWVNQDDVPHTVRSVDGMLKSKALDTDDKFSFTFDKPGTYEYFCSVHPKMTAKIIVK